MVVQNCYLTASYLVAWANTKDSVNHRARLYNTQPLGVYPTNAHPELSQLSQERPVGPLAEHIVAWGS